MSLAKYLSCHWWVYKSHSQVLCPAVYLHDLFKTLNSSGCLLICLLFESFFQLYLKWNHIYVIIFFLWFSIWEKHSSERKQTSKQKKKLDGLPEMIVPLHVKERFNSKSICPQALHWDMLQILDTQRTKTCLHVKESFSDIFVFPSMTCHTLHGKALNKYLLD